MTAFLPSRLLLAMLLLLALGCWPPEVWGHDGSSSSSSSSSRAIAVNNNEVAHITADTGTYNDNYYEDGDGSSKSSSSNNNNKIRATGMLHFALLPHRDMTTSDASDHSDDSFTGVDPYWILLILLYIVIVGTVVILMNRMEKLLVRENKHICFA